MRVTILTLVLATFLAGCAIADDVTLVQGGEARAAIHIPSSPTPQERFAATGLQEHIAQASGAVLPIREGPGERAEPAILVAEVGRLDRVGQAALSRERALSIEGIVNRTAGRHVIVSGGGPRGVVYAAYALLERLGFRWYWPGETGQVTPELDDVVIADMRLIRDPSFIRRHAMGGPTDGWEDEQWGRDLVDWLVKNHQNFWLHHPPDDPGFLDRRGGRFTKVGSGHNWRHIIPPDEHFAAHPEWFPEIDGTRRKGGMLCLSNQEVLDRLTAYAVEGAEKMADNENVMFIDMTQNDGRDWCECDACRAIDDRDPDTHADILLWAINQAAEAAAEVNPDAKLMVYIYADAAGLPDWIEPHPNVFIEQTNYCFNYGASFLNPDSGRGRIFKRELDAWAQVTEHHGVYEYFGFYNWLEALPVTLYRLPEEVPYYHELGMDGFYSETEQRWSTNHLLYYAFSRMWWDHETDVEAMLDEFFELFWREAEEPMRDFYLRLETSGGPDRYWGGQRSNVLKIFPPDLRETCRADLERARELAVDDELVQRRLDFVELGWRYTELHLEALEAHQRFSADPTEENKQAAREAWQEYVAYFDELEGTHAFAARDLPRFRSRAEEGLARYELNLGALPPGEVEYADYLANGGNAYLHGRVEGFYPGTWGLSLRPEQSGTVTYELGAEKGHTWQSARVMLQGSMSEDVSCVVEYSLDGEIWRELLRDRAPERDDPFDLTEHVRGMQRFWIRARYDSDKDTSWCALQRFGVTGTIQ